MKKPKENIDKLKAEIAKLQKQLSELQAENDELKQELRDGKPLLELLFNKSQDLIFVHPYVYPDDKSGCFIDANQKAIDVLGYSLEELRELSPYDFISEADWESLPYEFSMLEKDRYFLFEKTLKTKSGQKFPAEINAHLFEVSGQVMAVSIARDLSTRKKLECQLFQSQALFHAIFENSPIGVVLFGDRADGHKPRINQAFADFLQYEKAELEKIPRKDFLATISHQDDLAEEYRLIDALQAGKITHYRLQKRFITREKKLVYGDVVMFVRDDKEKVRLSCALIEDITHRRNYEWALMKRECLFRETFTTIPDATLLWEQKADGRIILSKANLAAYIASESEIGQFIGRDIEDFFEENCEAISKVRAVLKTGERHHEQGALPYLRTGKKKWQLVDYIKVGENYVLNISRDISELKSAELEIQEHLKLESLLSQISAKFINIPMSQVDLAIKESLEMIGSFMKVERVALGVFALAVPLSQDIAYHWKSESLQAANFTRAHQSLSYMSELVDYLRKHGSIVASDPQQLPDCLRVPDFKFKATVKVLLEDHAESIIVITLDCANFEKVWPKNVVAKLHFIGRVFVNALKSKKWKEAIQKSQRQIKLITDSLPAMISYIGTDLRYIFANSGYEKTFVKENRKIVGHTVREVVGEHLYVRTKHFLNEVLAGKHVRHEGEFHFPNGAKRIMDVQFIPDKNEQGVVMGFFVYANDVTERKKTEEDRKKLEVQLRQAQKMEAIGSLAGGIAHDFNNILAMIIGYTELSREELARLNLSEKNDLDENLTGILTVSKRAKALVNQILTFSHRREHEKGPIVVGSVITEITKMFRSTMPASIEVSAKIEAQNTTILGNTTQIHQVLMNLCTNAIQSMEEIGGKLELSAKVATNDELIALQLMEGQEKKYLKITVSDTGHGIPQGILERIFEPYFTTKKKGGGSGMGLAVVHGIVRAHQGQIRVESNFKKGTTFYIYFPVIKNMKVKNQTPDDVVVIERGKERILLVDDEPLIVNVQKKFLTQLGYMVSPYTSSVEAFEAFRATPHAFDVLVTDLNMPMLSGEKFAMEVKQIRPELLVVLCTGFSDKISEETAKDYGVDKLLIKPFGKKVLAKALRTLLDNKE